MASSDLRQMLELVGAWEGFEIEGWSIDEGLTRAIRSTRVS